LVIGIIGRKDPFHSCARSTKKKTSFLGRFSIQLTNN